MKGTLGEIATERTRERERETEKDIGRERDSEREREIARDKIGRGKIRKVRHPYQRDGLTFESSSKLSGLISL